MTVKAAAALVFPRQAEPSLEKIPVQGDAPHRNAARLFTMTRWYTRVFLPLDGLLAIVGLIGFIAGSSVFLVLLLIGLVLFVTGVVLARATVKRFAVADATAGIPVPEEAHLDVSKAVIQFGVTRQTLQRAMTSPDRADEVDKQLRTLAPKIQLLEARNFTLLQGIRSAWLAGDEKTWRQRSDQVIALGDEVKALRQSVY